jgi:hypothetical protein
MGKITCTPTTLPVNKTRLLQRKLTRGGWNEESNGGYQRGNGRALSQRKQYSYTALCESSSLGVFRPKAPSLQVVSICRHPSCLSSHEIFFCLKQRSWIWQACRCGCFRMACRLKVSRTYRWPGFCVYRNFPSHETLSNCLQCRKQKKKLDAKFKQEQKALYQQYYEDVYSLQIQNAELIQALEQVSPDYHRRLHHDGGPSSD